MKLYYEKEYHAIKSLVTYTSQLAAPLLSKMLKYLEVLRKFFEFSNVKEVVEYSLVYCKYVSMNYPIMFLDRDNKARLVPVSFSYFLELL